MSYDYDQIMIKNDRHPWCSDPSRDEAVRAAEDNRQGPLPTLADVIAEPFADSAKCSMTASEMGGEQSWLRTDRVTLECVHRFKQHPSVWDWWRLMELRPGESVRVVEESHFDDLANVAMERDAAIRERDALRAERITQALTADRFAAAVAEADTLRGRVAELESQLESVACRAATAETALESAPAASDVAGTHAAFFQSDMPLNFQYAEDSFFPPNVHGFLRQGVRLRDGAAPQPAPGWLTAEERGSIQLAANISKASFSYSLAQELENILARKSPPEVVLPVSTIGRGERYDGDWIEGWIACRDRCAAALAAAGVTVREVAK